MKNISSLSILFSLFLLELHANNLSLPTNSNANSVNSTVITNLENNLSLHENKKCNSKEDIIAFFNCDDDNRLRSSAKIFAYGNLVGLMTLLALPESVTNWDKQEMKSEFKWWENVKRKPVMDKDDAFLNYVTHPYWGMVYYVQGREAGYSKMDSIIISFLFSATWEYGIEAIAERPSIQDLIVTPLGGAIFGEYAYENIKDIQKNNYKVFDSTTLGYISVFILDPLHFIVNDSHGKNHTTSLIPTKKGLMLSFNMKF